MRISPNLVVWLGAPLICTVLDSQNYWNELGDTPPPKDTVTKKNQFLIISKYTHAQKVEWGLEKFWESHPIHRQC